MILTVTTVESDGVPWSVATSLISNTAEPLVIRAHGLTTPSGCVGPTVT